MTNADLFPMIQTIKPTNIHVLFQTKSLPPVNCLPRLNYRLPPRGRQLIFRILPKIQPQPSLQSSEPMNNRLDGVIVDESAPSTSSDSSAVNRRLVFNSPLVNCSSRKKWTGNNELDLSGIIHLEHVDVDEQVTEVREKCWFQLRPVLQGFLGNVF